MMDMNPSVCGCLLG